MNPANMITKQHTNNEIKNDIVLKLLAVKCSYPTQQRSKERAVFGRDKLIKYTHRMVVKATN